MNSENREKRDFSRFFLCSELLRNSYQLKIRRENHAEFEVAPTGVDPVTFRFSVERSTN